MAKLIDTDNLSQGLQGVIDLANEKIEIEKDRAMAVEGNIQSTIQKHANYINNFTTEIADIKSKIGRYSYKNSTHDGNGNYPTRYFKIGTMVIDNASNYGNINISGRIGGWEQINSASFEIMFLNRSSARDGMTITSTVTATGEYDAAVEKCDICIYRQEDRSEIIYFKLTGYYLMDISYSYYQHTLDLDNMTEETPTGTLVWSLSNAPKTILSTSGTLSQTGQPTNDDDLTTKNYVDNKIAGHRHATPQPGNYFVNGYAGMTQDGVMEVGKYQDWHNSNDDALDYSVRVQCDSSNGNTVYLPTKSGRLAVLDDCGAYLNRNNDLDTEESNKQHKMQFAQTSGNDIMMPDTYWWSLLRLQHGGYEAGYWQDIAVSFDGIMKVRYNQNGKYGPWRQVAYVDQLEGLGGGDSSAVNGHSIWSGTQAEYDALTSKSDSTLYFIVG